MLLIADGARWIRNFYSDLLAQVPDKQMILDWYHLRKKCYGLSSMICRGCKAEAAFLETLYCHLWCGQVDETIQVLQAYCPQVKNEKALDQLIAYLQARQGYIPDYGQRRQERRYIGSAHAEPEETRNALEPGNQ
ncbi:MAG: hypothetical protein J7M34_09260 [Anaerolineae bacterium]|nr:hypothetical protein [Anaerolineae bacterium]